MIIPLESQTDKQWWTPVWKGLVMDKEAKHFKKMKNAIWLYLYLMLNAKRSNGYLMKKIGTICKDMGISRATIKGWLNVLRTRGYISTQNTGRCLLIQVHKWKAVGGNVIQQVYKPAYTRSIGNKTSVQTPETSKSRTNWAKIGDILRS